MCVSHTCTIHHKICHCVYECARKRVCVCACVYVLVCNVYYSILYNVYIRFDPGAFWEHVHVYVL